MSSTALPGGVSSSDKSTTTNDSISEGLWKAISILASMKLTVFLFVLGMIVVFIGSLAQARKDVWLVVGEYFRTYIAWIDVADLFPPSMFPRAIDFDWDRLGILRFIPFPGGWTIGWIMLANLLTAHYLRFRINVSGMRRYAGVAIIGLGALLTGLVVWTGNQQTGVEYGDTILSPERIWYLMLGVMAVATALPLFSAFMNSGMSKPERILMGAIGVTLGSVLAYFVIGGEEARLNLSSMRILWQLLKGTACAVVLLIGCKLLFEKRGGIVLLHLGVALLMYSELQVGFFAKENLLALQEGQTQSYMRDIRERELAIVQRVDGKENVVVVPESRLIAAAAADAGSAQQVVNIDGLPFAVRIDQFLRNSQLRSVLPDDPKSSIGLGMFATADEIDPVTGMDDSHDISTVRLALLDKESGKELDTMLCSQNVSEMRTVPIAEQAVVGKDEYQFYLRFQRNYKDYEVELLDVSKKDYVGTSTPKDYRSQIIITDKATGAADEFTLWMNNPLRYKGETFYQSGYNKLEDGTEMTTLSVVKNTGWMLPYIACMIVAVGMFAQFGLTLGRYLSRFDRSTDKLKADSESTSNLPEGIRAAAVSKPETYDQTAAVPGASPWPILLPTILVLLGAAWVAGKARAPKEDPAAMNMYGFAQLPVAWKGRAQPIDSFARTELLLASHKSTFKGELSAAELDHPEKREAVVQQITKYWPSVKAEELDGFSGEYSEWVEHVMKLTSSGRDAVEDRIRGTMVARMPAVRWFLDVVARPENARRHRVIKIDDDQVLSLLGLEKRAGLAYSVEEIQKNLGELESINREGMKLQMAEQEHRMSQLQRRVVKLFQTVSRVDSLANIFLVRDSEGLLDSVVKAWWVLDRLGNSPAIMAVPTGLENEQRSWETLIASSALQNVKQEFKAAGLNSSEEVAQYISDKLPGQLVSRESVTDSVKGSIDILKAAIKSNNDGVDATDEELKQRALGGSQQLQEPYLRKILGMIGKADAGASVEEIMASVTDADIRQMAIEKISGEVFQIFESMQEKQDERLESMRVRAQADAAAGTEENVIAEQMNLELLKFALNDLDERAGELLYQDTEVFDNGTRAIRDALTAWSLGDVEQFNTNVKDYKSFLAANTVAHLDSSKVSFETFFNLLEPFMKAIYLYLPVLLLSFLSWIVWPKTLRRSGLWLMGLAFVIHTAALLMRMHISGRPPVTNLYSSAIFIGWAVVGASFIVERLLKNGIGNILGASVGMGTLVIAHYLARDEGDTLGVMQAVLDTTFWLATHVVCITLGYAATFLAGALGVAYCGMTMLGKNKEKPEMVSLGKIIYGVLCFAVFFSLVGTVLGGLWADDSWGRFWGWDPKENGAMLIVMWNALILHARWDKMVRDYGTAVLAMGGNIVTAWSWFGVNELKAGLHTYGFTEGRLLALLVFCGIQGVVIFAAIIPAMESKSKDKISPA